jgi:hypothetical protein
MDIPLTVMSLELPRGATSSTMSPTISHDVAVLQHPHVSLRCVLETTLSYIVLRW